MPNLKRNPNLAANGPEEAVNELNRAPKLFYQKEAQFEEVQIEKLDEEVDITKIYKIKEPPVFIDRFLVSIPPNEENEDGIDFFDLGMETNFHLPTHQFLGLLHSKARSIHTISEILENHIKMIVDDIQIREVKDFQQDWRYRFRRFNLNRLTAGSLKKIRRYS